MVRRFHRSIYEELDELRASMDYLYQLALEPAEVPLSPLADDTRIVCRNVHNPAADVSIQDEFVTVTADIAPGTGEEQVSVDLTDDTTLIITTGCSGGEPGGAGGSAGPERASFALRRIVPLPTPVTREGARLTLRHHVLDLHLRKTGLQ